jgi:NADPH-dependent 2,4-dienoyl-CoA reductase/sulfur reductase-like enzyme
MSANEILIVGAGLGAFRCSQQLRQRGYRGSITVLGAEQHRPYDRPPLSKQVLRGERDSTTFAVAQPLDVNWVGGCRAVSLDTSSREVICGDGRVRIYDALILAPGGRPRMLPGVSRGAGVHVLRTIDDALAIRTSMNASKHIVVVGGGFIGCEIAASARRQGFEVDLIEGLALPLRGVLGPQAASRVTDLHEAQGVRMHLGAAVEEVVRDEAGNVCGVRLGDGTFVAGRNVVVGIGIVPDVDWLVGTGIELGDGIRCDGNGRTSVPNVYALGDAAEWWHPLMKECRRIEH